MVLVAVSKFCILNYIPANADGLLLNFEGLLIRILEGLLDGLLDGLFEGLFFNDFLESYRLFH